MHRTVIRVRERCGCAQSKVSQAQCTQQGQHASSSWLRIKVLIAFETKTVNHRSKAQQDGSVCKSADCEHPRPLVVVVHRDSPYVTALTSAPSLVFPLSLSIPQTHRFSLHPSLLRSSIFTSSGHHKHAGPPAQEEVPRGHPG